MEANNIDILKKIKRVDTDPAMYDRIMFRIGQRTRAIVPLYQVGIVALLIFGLLVCDIIIINQLKSQNNQNGLEQILVQNNNNLYHE
jgi:hypothetical protein